MSLDRRNAPAFRQVETIPLLHPTAYTLSNGLNVYVINAGEQELVRIEFYYRNPGFDPAQPLSPAAVSGMLLDGTVSRRGPDISGFVDYHGAFLQPDFTFDHTSLTLFTLNKHVDKLLPVLADVLSESIFPEADLETFKRNNKQKLAVTLKKNDVLARRTLNELVFGSSSTYGFSAQPEDYDRIRQAELLRYFEEVFCPANLTIIVSGKVSPDIIASLDTHFGAAALTGEPGGQSVVHFPDHAGGLQLVEKPDSLQSAIRMGKRSINRTHADFPGMQVLLTILGGYFGSRLMSNIREDKGYTYGIGAGLASFSQSGFLYIATEVGKDVCRPAIAEIEKEIEILRTVPVGAEELTLVKNYLMGSLLGDLENAFSHADKFKTLHFFGLGYDYYDRYIDTVKHISPEDLQALANRYLDFGGFRQVVVGSL